MCCCIVDWWFQPKDDPSWLQGGPLSFELVYNLWKPPMAKEIFTRFYHKPYWISIFIHQLSGDRTIFFGSMAWNHQRVSQDEAWASCLAKHLTTLEKQPLTEAGSWAWRKRGTVWLRMIPTHCYIYVYTYIYIYIHTLHYIALHCIALHNITLHYITLHYTTYIHTYIHTSIHPSIHPSMHACMQTDRQTDRQTCRHADMHACRHACRHTYIHTYRHTYSHTYRHTHTAIHTYVRTYVRTYIHTYIQ